MRLPLSLMMHIRFTSPVLIKRLLCFFVIGEQFSVDQELIQALARGGKLDGIEDVTGGSSNEPFLDTSNMDGQVNDWVHLGGHVPQYLETTTWEVIELRPRSSPPETPASSHSMSEVAVKALGNEGAQRLGELPGEQDGRVATNRQHGMASVEELASEVTCLLATHRAVNEIAEQTRQLVSRDPELGEFLLQKLAERTDAISGANYARLGEVLATLARAGSPDAQAAICRVFTPGAESLIILAFAALASMQNDSAVREIKRRASVFSFRPRAERVVAKNVLRGDDPQVLELQERLAHLESVKVARGFSQEWRQQFAQTLDALSPNRLLEPF